MEDKSHHGRGRYKDFQIVYLPMGGVSVMGVSRGWWGLQGARNSLVESVAKTRIRTTSGGSAIDANDTIRWEVASSQRSLKGGSE